MISEVLLVKSDNNALFESYYQTFILECKNHSEYEKLFLLRLYNNKKKEAYQKAYDIMTNEIKKNMNNIGNNFFNSAKPSGLVPPEKS